MREEKEGDICRWGKREKERYKKIKQSKSKNCGGKLEREIERDKEVEWLCRIFLKDLIEKDSQRKTYRDRNQLL